MSSTIFLSLILIGSVAFATEPIASFRFDGPLPETVTLGPGAHFVDSPEGRGIQPGDSFAAEIRLPDGFWKPRGTLAFRFRMDQTLRHRDERQETVRVIDGAPVPADLRRMGLHPRILLNPEDAKRFGHTDFLLTVRRQYPAGSTVGSWQFSRLDADEWYHLAIAWDAEAGRMECYVNGVVQNGMTLDPWPFHPVENPLRLGGVYRGAHMAVDSVEIYDTFLDEAAVGESLRGRDIPAPDGDTRTLHPGKIDLSGLKRTLVYEADFTKPLDLIFEDDLFDGDKRAREPKPDQWVLEGQGRAWTEGGALHLDTVAPGTKGSHVVLWHARRYPADMLLEFGMVPGNPRQGLNILFFANTALDGGSVFGLDLPKRAGNFRSYHSDRLNGYHTSYFVAASKTGHPETFFLRRTANLRKNRGFQLVSIGEGRIAGHGPGPFDVRVLKVGPRVQIEAAGGLAVDWADKGDLGQPAWGDGFIGLRQMRHSRECAYTYFRLWKIEAAGR